MLVNELVKMQEYDVYNNPEITKENIEKLAQAIFDEGVDINEFFDVLKCTSKFCWRNFIRIFDCASYDNKLKGMPLMFTLLQDSNWPVYKDAVKFLQKFEYETLEPYIDEFLSQAYREDDEMWIDNILRLKAKVSQIPRSKL